MKQKAFISLGSHYEKFIDEEVTSGRYGSHEDVIRTALDLLKIEENKIHLLRDELESGEESPVIENFNPQEHLFELHKKYT
jgi:antitoxin ParD1/3/4